MKFLGIDPGEKYFGLAIGEEEIKTAFPYQVLEFKKIESLIKDLKDIIVKEKIDKIVIGRPVNFSGQPTKETEILEKIEQEIKKEVFIPIIQFDERLTSKMASKLLLGEKNNHAVAAQIILQDYLNKND
jgi:putative holliday junction resolvase